MNDSWPSTLQTIYSECNEHLREQDTKRDQMLAFFIALTGFLLSQDNLAGDAVVAGIIYVFMFILGIVVALIIGRYKGWHEKYVLAITTISTVMAQNLTTDYKEFNKVYRECAKKKKIDFGSVFWSSESLILNAFLMINCLNVIVAFYSFFTINVYVILVLCVIITSYVVAFKFSVYVTMKKSI